MLPETPYVLYMHYNIRVTHRNVIGLIFLHESDPRRDHWVIVLYSFCRSMLVLHLAVKILLQIFLYEDFDIANTLAYICRLYFLQKCQQGPQLRYANANTIMKTFLIFDINHQQNTRRSDQIETIKMIMQTTRPRIIQYLINGSGCHF